MKKNNFLSIVIGLLLSGIVHADTEKEFLMLTENLLSSPYRVERIKLYNENPSAICSRKSNKQEEQTRIEIIQYKMFLQKYKKHYLGKQKEWFLKEKEVRITFNNNTISLLKDSKKCVEKSEEINSFLNCKNNENQKMIENEKLLNEFKEDFTQANQQTELYFFLSSLPECLMNK